MTSSAARNANKASSSSNCAAMKSICVALSHKSTHSSVPLTEAKDPSTHSLMDLDPSAKHEM